VGGCKLGSNEDSLIELVKQDPDIMLAKLRSAAIEVEGMTIGAPAIFRKLKSLGFTYKKDAGRE
jgi:transposase